MPSVSVSELKAHLAKYLRTARRGGEVQVLERGIPIARLVGLAGGPPPADRVKRLTRAGVLRPGTSDLRWLAKEAPLRVGDADVGIALEEDRSDRL